MRRRAGAFVISKYVLRSPARGRPNSSNSDKVLVSHRPDIRRGQGDEGLGLTRGPDKLHLNCVSGMHVDHRAQVARPEPKFRQVSG